MAHKYIKGEWKVMIKKFPTPPKEVVTGVGIEDKNIPGYFRVIVDMIHPETDAKYIKEHEEIKATAQLISASPIMLIALEEIKTLEKGSNAEEINKIIDYALHKALKEQ